MVSRRVYTRPRVDVADPGEGGDERWVGDWMGMGGMLANVKLGLNAELEKCQLVLDVRSSFPPQKFAHTALKKRLLQTSSHACVSAVL